MQGMVDQLEALANEEIPQTYLERIAKLGLEFDRPDIAADLYDRLADIDPQGRPHWLALAGQWNLATARHQRAGQAYHEAFTLTTNADEAQRFALLALDAFHAGNDQRAALSFVTEQLDRFPDNRQLLERAIAIARAQSMLRTGAAVGKPIVGIGSDKRKVD